MSNGFGKGCYLHLIDASGYIFRAYHALPPLTRKSDGLPVGAVSGYCNMIHKLLQELRGLGRNLHPQRFAALRGRNWRAQLEQALAQRLAGARGDGQLALSFEIIYGHAFKPTPRMKVQGESSISVQDMQQMLRQGRMGGV